MKRKKGIEIPVEMCYTSPVKIRKAEMKMQCSVFVKMLSLLLIAAAVLCLASCGKKEVNPDAVLAAVQKDVKFDYELSDAGSAASMFFSNLPDGAQVKLYKGAGEYSDEIAILTGASEADAQKLEAAAKAHIQELHNSYANYVPAELDKIDNAVIKVAGKYVFVCVTNDYGNAATVLDRAIG